MNDPLLRFENTLQHDPAIDRWLDAHPGPLGAIARTWFNHLRACGDEVRELFHDGCANACLGDAPFAYVNIFTAHVNVGFFAGYALRDPHHLLQGSGRRMRHVRLKPGSIDEEGLRLLLQAAYTDIKFRVENG